MFRTLDKKARVVALRVVRKAKKKPKRIAVCSRYGYVYWETKGK